MNNDYTKRYLIHANTNVEGYSYVRDGKRISVRPYIRSIKRKVVQKVGQKAIRGIDRGLSYGKRKLENRIANYFDRTRNEDKSSSFERGKRTISDNRRKEIIRYNKGSYEELTAPVVPRFNVDTEVGSRLHTGPMKSRVNYIVDLGKYAVQKFQYDIAPEDTRGYVEANRESYLEGLERTRKLQEQAARERALQPDLVDETIEKIRNNPFVQNYQKAPGSHDRLDKILYTVFKTPYDVLTASAEADRRHLEDLGLSGRGVTLTRTPGGPGERRKQTK